MSLLHEAGGGAAEVEPGPTLIFSKDTTAVRAAVKDQKTKIILQRGFPHSLPQKLRNRLDQTRGGESVEQRLRTQTVFDDAVTRPLTQRRGSREEWWPFSNAGAASR